MKLNPETLARASSRHPWRTVAIWAVILVLGFRGIGRHVERARSRRTSTSSNNPEAKQAKTLLDQKQLRAGRHRRKTFVMIDGPGTVTDPAFTGQVNAALNDIRGRSSRRRTTVPASYPLTADQAQDPQVAALGPIESEDGTGGPVHA